MNNLIDIGKLSRAYSIAKYFKYMNQDLRTILVRELTELIEFKLLNLFITIIEYALCLFEHDETR